MNTFSSFKKLYRDALFNDVLPFWDRHSIDKECGGFFTCLDRNGTVYDTDKFLWLQARQVWTYSALWNNEQKRPEWLEMARHGAEFLMTHGMDGSGAWYFSLTREGTPLVQPYNVFSDLFAAMALSQYALASGDERARELAGQTYRHILMRRENPKGKYSKSVPLARPLKSLSLPLILLNASVEMEWQLEQPQFEDVTGQCVREMTTLLLDKQRMLFYEHVQPDGSHLDSFEGRLINPGHGIEACWFLAEFGRRTNDNQLIQTAVQATLSTLEFGWDNDHGGIFYFLDADGKPPLQLEWDQKLWWGHLESLIALSLGYFLTGNNKCLEWFERVHEYAWNHFPDHELGEWFGYLNRRGEVLLPLKGGKWKGCFHLPRALWICSEIFNDLQGKDPPSH